MKVLVTGANGLVGSNLVQALLARKYEVRAMVRTTSNLKSLEGLNVELAYGDILQPETLVEAVKGCEIVFHVAGIFSYWGHKREKLIGSAKTGVRNVMNAVKAGGAKRMVLTSSSVTLGAESNGVVLTEAAPGPLEEDLAYCTSKVEQEKLAFELAGKYGIDLVVVCPTLAVGGPDYGLTESNHMLINYLKDPYRTTWIGGCNIVSVKDVAEGHIIAAEKGISGEKYILGSENLEWADVHKILTELSGLPGPYWTANHTASILLSGLHEIESAITGKAPSSSMEQGKMVGKYYWYDHAKIGQLGYAPRPAKMALIEAVSWLVASNHIPNAVRSTIKLSPLIYQYRNGI